MKWYGGTSYQEKFDRVIATIERAEAKGYTVLLIGESAGASMAMNVFAQRDSLHRLVSLCGVNSPHASISPRIFAHSPAFKGSMARLEGSRQKAVKERIDQVSSVTALSDPVVAISANNIPGTKHVRVLSFGHLATILLCLSLYSFVLARQVKRFV